VRGWRFALVAVALAAGSACSTLPGGGPSVADCPGEIGDTGEISEDFLARESWQITAGGRSHGLEVAVQVKDRALVLVAFHPLGAKLFTVTQQGTEVEVIANPGPPLEIAPENVLRDVHRIHFFALPPPGFDGPVSMQRDSVHILEQWQSGALRERRILVTGEPAARAVLTFEGGADTAGSVVRVDHPACGYVAEVRTLSRRSLP
jgi:hypothetical protein